jgi:hypothetical protein
MGDVQQYQPTTITFNKKDLSQASHSQTDSPTELSESSASAPLAKKRNRCFACKKRLGLIPFTCKCGVLTCIQHKWPDHHCTYDFHAEAVERLTKDNPPVIAEKITRI